MAMFTHSGTPSASQSKDSTVWVWSSTSKHCYCKPHGTFLDVKRTGIVSGCKETGADCAVDSYQL